MGIHLYSFLESQKPPSPRTQQPKPQHEENNDNVTMNNSNIISDTNNENNPALKNFNQDKITPSKKSNRGNKKSSQKFPMPRKYHPNIYPDRNMTSIELTREMVDYYDNKNKPKEYQDFINKTLDYKKKD